MRQYLYPVDSLVDGKVFCFVDDVGKISKYLLCKDSIVNKDTFLVQTEYDRNFVLREGSVQLFTQSKLSILSFSLARDTVIVDSQCIPLAQPLTVGKETGYMSMTIRSNQQKIKMEVFSHFEPSTENFDDYKKAGCVKEVRSYRSYAISNNGIEKTTQMKDELTYAKGIGVVSYCRGNDSAKNRTHLGKIISMEEFRRIYSNVKKN
jgi:hypothetical protein